MPNNRTHTYHLPYTVRRDICNLLDADRSWQTLGGQFMALDATQLTLIGQAHLRNASPTEELLRKLDAANSKISDLCMYLQRMNHEQALSVIRSYLEAVANNEQQLNHRQQAAMEAQPINSSLITPNPSLSDIQPTVSINSMEFDWLVDTENLANNDANNHDWTRIPTSRSRLAITNEVSPIGAQQVGALVESTQQQPRCHQSIAQEAVDQQAGSNLNNGGRHRQTPVNDQAQLDRLSNLLRDRTKQRHGLKDKEVEEQLKVVVEIPYNELQLGSDYFSETNLLGSGGFADVYRGCWKGTHVAIKRLRIEHINQALNEFVVLNKHKIDNVLPLYGLSIDGPEVCLVSQFMVNGSLGDRLACKNGTPPLSWQQRATIAEGVAKGLYYLHTVQPGKPLIHGDVKPANVLLDAQFVPKLADFGMARQMWAENGAPGYTSTQRGGCFTHCTVSSVQGTGFYLPHEFMRNKKLSEAVDVYSYGIVMLEMATGRQAFDGKRELIHLVADEMNSSIPQANLVYCHNLRDQRLVMQHQNQANGQDDDPASSMSLRIWFELLLTLGVSCSQQVRKKRPTMGQVLDHFAQFYQHLANSPPNTPIMNYLINGQLSSTCPTTATSRTLTPELTALDAAGSFHPLNNVAALNNNDCMRLGVQQPDCENLLMSVDDGPRDSSILQQHRPQAAGSACGGPVEDMIPLLTELGFESTQPTEQQQQQENKS